MYFGKEPSARDHFMEIDVGFSSELLGPLKGEALIDVSTNGEHNEIKTVNFFTMIEAIKLSLFFREI